MAGERGGATGEAMPLGGDGEGQGGAYLFRYGADMDPRRVRAATPGARFVARARLAGPAAGTQVAPPELSDPLDPSVGLWGILLRVPAGDAPDGAAEVIADDGRRFQARVGTVPDDLADPAAVVAAARYWELSPAYIGRLAAG